MSQQTKLIVGLGNPGPMYENTKHNVGFWVINALFQRRKPAKPQSLCRSLLALTKWGGTEVILAKPMTYMNNSGQAVAALVNRFAVSLSDLCIVYDDLHLDIGVLRMRRKGSDGGHNGMKSIIRCLGSQDFPRLRIGIGEPREAQIDHVLSKFSADEQAEIDAVILRAADAVETFITEDVQAVMNQFNGRVV